jgi:serine protease inhibitor
LIQQNKTVFAFRIRAHIKPPHQSVRQGRNSLFEDEDMKNLIAFVTSLATSQGAMAATHYVSAANAFGLKNMQCALEENASDNVIYSPISAHLALNMLLNGAASKTANEIAKTLNLTPGALAASNGEMMKRMEDLNSRPNGELKLTLANGMWTKPDLKVKPAYETAMQKYFQAEVAPLNSPAQINKWAADKTNNLITNVIDDIGGLEMFLVQRDLFQSRLDHALRQSLRRHIQLAWCNHA